MLYRNSCASIVEGKDKEKIGEILSFVSPLTTPLR
jgi:hypothetical protein